MIFNPWHSVEIGEKQPKFVNAIIEIPKNSQVKYELDKKTGMLKLDRYMYSSVHYPADYGFIPKTLWDDGDPLDIFILTSIPTYPMTLTEVKVIGVVEMRDEGEQDNKIIAVHVGDPRYSEWNDIDDVPKHFIKELRNFLETYKQLQGKKVEVYEIYGPKRAYQDIQKAIGLYNEAFKAN